MSSGGTSVTEVFKYDNGFVVLMDYDEERTTRFVRVGEFVIKLIKRAMNPTNSLVTCICMANELQWPLTKDSPIIRVAQRSFLFGFPGLPYGLQFPSSCQSHILDHLQDVVTKFGHYKDLNHKRTGYPIPDCDAEMWKKLRPLVAPMVHATLSEFGHIAGKSPSSSSSDLLRLIRMSAATKMISKAILLGSLKEAHIHVENTTKPEEETNYHTKNNMKDKSSWTYGSICVFTNVVDAVEISWAITSGKPPHNLLLREMSGGVLDPQPQGFKVWRLNRKGVVFFMEELALSAAFEKMIHQHKSF